MSSCSLCFVSPLLIVILLRSLWSVDCCALFVVGCWLFAVCCWLFVAGCVLFAVGKTLRVVC